MAICETPSCEETAVTSKEHPLGGQYCVDCALNLHNKDSDKYNGWTNRATWNVALWVSNDKPIYDKLMVVCKELALEGCHWTDEMALEFSKEIFGNMTPDKDSLDDANWQEIADAWNEDVKWHAEDLEEERQGIDEGDQDAADAMKEREYLEELEAEESK